MKSQERQSKAVNHKRQEASIWNKSNTKTNVQQQMATMQHYREEKRGHSWMACAPLCTGILSDCKVSTGYCKVVKIEIVRGYIWTECNYCLAKQPWLCVIRIDRVNLIEIYWLYFFHLLSVKLLVTFNVTCQVARKVLFIFFYSFTCFCHLNTAMLEHRFSRHRF